MLCSNYKSLRRGMLAASVSLAAVFAGHGVAEAGQFWIRGNKIYFSGTTQLSDGRTLASIVNQARAQGRTIDTVVFRDAPGGALVGGSEMATFISNNNMSTIFQGGCYSACAIAFAAGDQRGMARFELPGAFTVYTENILGFHGASLGGVPASRDIQQTVFDLVQSLLGSSVTPEALERLRLAHFDLQDSQGFLRYTDPSTTARPLVSFCPTGAAWTTNSLSGCTTYAGANIYTDGILTQPGYVSVDDTLKIKNTVSGDLNPNWRTYNDQYGLITIEDGGTWNVSSRTNAFSTWVRAGGAINVQSGGIVGQGGQVVVDAGGFINLQGGTLSTQPNYEDAIADLRSGFLGGSSTDQPLLNVRLGGQIGGTGRIVGNTFIRGTFAPDNITISHNTVSGTLSRGSVDTFQLSPTSLTRFTVSSETVRAALINERAESYSYLFGTLTAIGAIRSQGLTPVIIDNGATLGVNFTRSFYRPGQVIPLMAGVTDTRVAQKPDCLFCINEGAATAPPRQPTPFFTGRFSTFLRVNDGSVIKLDPALASQLIGVGEDSLLGFDLVYTTSPDLVGLLGGLLSPSYRNNFSALSLVARPAFNDTSLFANAASGDGVGRTLLTASNGANPGISELLGALQFSSRTAARAAAPVLRGDAYASQRLNDQTLVASLDDLLFARILDAGSNRPDVAQPFAIDLAEGDNRPANGIVQTGGNLVRQLVGGPQADQTPERTGWNGWGRFFSGKVETDAGLGVASLDSDYRGVMVGADRRLGDGNKTVGFSLAYVTSDSEAVNDAYANDTDVLSGALYGTLKHGRGEVTGSVRASRFENEAVRRVTGIGGLESSVNGDYSTTDVSARIESTIDGPTLRGTSLRFVLPTLAYQRSDTLSIAETGGAFRLNVEGEKQETFRVGVGAELSRVVERGDAQVMPLLKVNYERELADANSALNASFVGEGNLPFTVNSQVVGRDIISLKAGITIVDINKVAITAQYQSRLRDGQDQHGGFLGLSYRF